MHEVCWIQAAAIAETLVRRACLQAWPIGHRLKEVRTIKDVAENQKYRAPAATRAIDGAF